jgi:hypothetical protein
VQDVIMTGNCDDVLQVFVSYAGSDRAWAEWAAAQLDAAGLAVELDVWEWRAGDNAPLLMSRAVERADVVLALWSPAYFGSSRFTEDEWTSVLADRPDARKRLVPVRVAVVTPPQGLRALLYRDLFDVDETTARRELLAAVMGPSGRGDRAPFPGAVRGAGGPPSASTGGPRLPGSLPGVWNVRNRLKGFTGRQSLLAGLRVQLVAGHTTVVVAMNGLGGVGKTSLAVEYAHLFAGEYDVVWWVDAERPELVGEALSRMAVAAGWAPPEAPVPVAWEVLTARLRQVGRWLVVFDNVESPDHVRSWLPQGPGQVIITSRHRGFTGLAVPLEVQVFPRTESLDLIATHLPTLRLDQAKALAQALGDLPLGLAQAIGLLAETGMTVSEYLTELEGHTVELLAEGRGGSYPVSLAAAIETTLARLGPQDPAGLEVLRLCAVLAPDPIPLDWIRGAPPDALPSELAAVATRPLALRRSLGRLADLGLAQVGDSTILVHRLTQAVLRHRPTIDRSLIGCAVALLAAAAPDNDGSDPSSWPAWAMLLPHLLALDPVTAPVEIRATACDALYFLLMNGQVRTALTLAKAWCVAWQRTVGIADRYVLWAAHHQGIALRLAGKAQEAYDLDRETLERRRQAFGEDDPDTLRSVNAVALNHSMLGRHQDAYDLHRDLLERRQRILGRDHRDSLDSAHALAIDLFDLGQYAEASKLDKDTFQRLRQVLGEQHLLTLESATRLATDLRALGRYQEAYNLDRVTSADGRRVLGPYHYVALEAANNLAADLRALGRYQEAYDMDVATLEARRRVLGRNHRDSVTSATNLALDLRALGRPEEVISLESG